MQGFLIVIAIIAVLFLIANSTAKQEIQREKEINRESGILYKDSTVKYLGGFPTIEGDKNCTLEIKDIYLNLSIEGNSTRVISLSKIKDVRIISKEQLQEKINLGKLIVFGWLSLAMKKDSKTIVNNFLQIEYNNGTEDLSLIFMSDKLETTCRQLRNSINI